MRKNMFFLVFAALASFSYANLEDNPDFIVERANLNDPLREECSEKWDIEVFLHDKYQFTIVVQEYSKKIGAEVLFGKFTDGVTIRTSQHCEWVDKSTAERELETHIFNCKWYSKCDY